MKKDLVPQDDDNLLEGKFKVLKYATDSDGKYIGVGSKGWEPENVALKQAWDVINKRVKEAKEQVLSGKASPLFYHMEKNLMDPKLLANHAGYFTWTVKRHLKPAVFKKLSNKRLENYARVFNITVDELITLKEKDEH